MLDQVAQLRASRIDLHRERSTPSRIEHRFGDVGEHAGGAYGKHRVQPSLCCSS